MDFDRTIIYYTANKTNEVLAKNTREQLIKSNSRFNYPIISVSKKPIDLGENICVGDTPTNLNWAWRQALIGAKAAKTKYIALAEDDMFYSPEHFWSYLPKPGVFGYNSVVWMLQLWGEKVFSYRGEVARMHSLICERDLFIETLEELFEKFKGDEETLLKLIGEPGRVEKRQGTTPRAYELFHTPTPNIVIIHQDALGYSAQGKRKKLGYLRVTGLPYWGTVDEVMKMCQAENGGDDG